MDMATAVVIATLISTLGMIFGIYRIQIFWDHKWDKNLDFEKFKIKENKRAAKWKIQHTIKNPKPENIATKVMDLIPLMNKLDPDTIKLLIDKFLPKDYKYEEDNLSTAIADILGIGNSDAIKGFLDGLTKKTKKSTTEEKKDQIDTTFFED